MKKQPCDPRQHSTSWRLVSCYPNFVIRCQEPVSFSSWLVWFFFSFLFLSHFLFLFTLNTANRVADRRILCELSDLTEVHQSSQLDTHEIPCTLPRLLCISKRWSGFWAHGQTIPAARSCVLCIIHWWGSCGTSCTCLPNNCTKFLAQLPPISFFEPYVDVLLVFLE